MVTTLGRELIREKLPEKFKDYADTVLDKKNTTKLMTELAKDDPDAYVNILQDMNNIAQQVVSTYGRDASLSYADLKGSTKVNNLNKQLRALVDTTLDNDKLTIKQKEDRIKDLGYKYSEKVRDAVLRDHQERKTALASQINSGSRGNPTQLMQLGFGNMLMKDALNRDIPYLMLDPYTKGATPMGYWVSASSGRKGFYDVQAATGQSGYLGKQVTAATHDTTISEPDCGTTDTGVPFPADTMGNVGAVLLRPFKNHPAGSIVTEKMVSEADEGDEMILRSPTTCKSAHGICAKCNGLGENGKFPGIGEYVPLNAARSFVEVITQAGIGCLHPGTQVRMADWTIKAMRDIQVGDTVMGCSEDGRLAPATVTNVFDNGMQEMWLTSYRRGFRTPAMAHLVSTLNHKALQVISELGDKEEKHNSQPRVLPVGENAIDIGMYSPTIPGGLNTNSDSRDVDSHNIFKRTSQKYLGTMPAVDIEVDNESHLFLLANGLVVSNSKHTGGVGGKRYNDPEGEDQPHGFESLERMFMAPENFKGGAVLTPQDGTVGSVKAAPQGGTYISIDGETIYASPERTVKVKPGDKVYAGDVLTNGVPNPREIMELKGLGEGRRYFTNKMNDILKSEGWGTDRRNLEAFTRSMISRVEITDPDGYRNYRPGDIVDYNILAADYKPRDGAVTEKVDKAINKYLEAPVLFYSVGTRITPGIAKELKKYKFDDVTVSDKEPAFSAKFLRPASVLQSNENWLPRLAGERLRDGLFDAAREEVTDPFDSHSYVNKIVAAPFK